MAAKKMDLAEAIARTRTRRSLTVTLAAKLTLPLKDRDVA
jgi:hypothetical protein